MRLYTMSIIVYPFDDCFECVSEYGPCVEINLTFTTHRWDPLPLEYNIQNDVTYHEIVCLDEYRRLFTSSLE
jgi:hypothetical protein